jgi:hypothetical protein
MSPFGNGRKENGLKKMKRNGDCKSNGKQHFPKLI